MIAVLCSTDSRSSGRVTAPNALRMRENELKFSIALDKETYYDNDNVNGLLVIQSPERRVLPPIWLGIECKLLVREISMWNFASHSLFRSFKLSGAERQNRFIAEEGITEVPFTFSLPEHLPPSFKHKRVSISWELKAVHKRFWPITTLASVLFQKGSFFFCIPGHIPLAQTEAKVLSLPGLFRAEASLSKDVYADGEPIKIAIAVFNPTMVPCLESLQAKIVQMVRVKYQSQTLWSSHHVLDSCRHKPRYWPAEKLGTGPRGSVQEKTFMLLLQARQPNRAKKMAGQAEATPCPALSPTTNYKDVENGVNVSVQYSVEIKFIARYSDVYRLSLPFCCQSYNGLSPIGSSLDNLHDMENLHDICVFPQIDEPPAYEIHQAKSVASYTCLRRGSADSLFGQIATTCSG